MQDDKNHPRCFLCPHVTTEAQPSLLVSTHTPTTRQITSGTVRTRAGQLTQGSGVQAGAHQRGTEAKCYHLVTSNFRNKSISNEPLREGPHTYQTLRELAEKRRLHQASGPFQRVGSNHKRHRLNYSDFPDCLVRVRSSQH